MLSLGSPNHSKHITNTWHVSHFYLSWFLRTPTNKISLFSSSFFHVGFNYKTSQGFFFFFNRKIPLAPPGEVWSQSFQTCPSVSHLFFHLQMPWGSTADFCSGASCRLFYKSWSTHAFGSPINPTYIYNFTGGALVAGQGKGKVRESIQTYRSPPPGEQWCLWLGDQAILIVLLPRQWATQMLQTCCW